MVQVHAFAVDGFIAGLQLQLGGVGHFAKEIFIQRFDVIGVCRLLLEVGHPFHVYAVVQPFSSRIGKIRGGDGKGFSGPFRQYGQCLRRYVCGKRNRPLGHFQCAFYRSHLSALLLNVVEAQLHLAEGRHSRRVRARFLQRSLIQLQRNLDGALALHRLHIEGA
ncbi:hypothetical protein D3C81_1471410 [compost metagenome]